MAMRELVRLLFPTLGQIFRSLHNLVVENLLLRHQLQIASSGSCSDAFTATGDDISSWLLDRAALRLQARVEPTPGFEPGTFS